MMQNESLDDFLSDMDPSMDSLDVTDALTEDALSLMDQALHTGEQGAAWSVMGCEPDQRNAFPLAGGLDFNDIDFLLELLWKDRCAMMNLSELGFLPGLPTLLFTLCEMTALSSSPQ